MLIDSNNTHFNNVGDADENLLLNNLNNCSLNTSTISNGHDLFKQLHRDSLLDENLLPMSIEGYNISPWRSSAGSSAGKSLFDSDEEDSIDLYGWRFKPVEEWDEVDTKNWLFRAGAKIGHSYSWMSPQLAIPGKELLGLTREDFIAMDPNFGEKLFDLFRKRAEARNSLSGSEFSSDDEASVGSDNVASDGDSDSGLGHNKKRVGRPSKKKPKAPRLKLWEFIRNLLLNPEYCPRLIYWDDYDKKIFRFIHSAQVAKLWGERNSLTNKTKKMTYEKFSRAMRYYYTKGIFKAVPGRRLFYQFGENATGLETNFPNFDPNYFRNVPKSEF